MKLQHTQYRAHFSADEYTPVMYYWEGGTFELPWVEPDKFHDLCDITLPHCGCTTQHLAEMVESITGREVKRLVAW